MGSQSAPYDLYRRIPSIDEALRTGPIRALEGEWGRASVVEALRAELEKLRRSIGAGQMEGAALAHALDALPAKVSDRVRHASARSLRRVINATGVLIHTNLGRAPLSQQAAEAVIACATGYSNLEFDIERGERGRRDDHASRLFTQLLARAGVASAATIVVNNNAAAVYLALAGLARGGEVIVSRGELIEIGGSFRIPDIMAESGAVLREVGTTNRTRIADYERAINDDTRLILRVHRSNFEIRGFTEQPDLCELIALGRRRGVPVMEDLGSGAMIDLRPFGVAGEASVADSLRAGASLVTGSGDKLLGGPQAGLISGAPELVARLRSHPMFRALRVDKMCYAALEATFASYLREDFGAIPLLRMLAAPGETIERRCRALAAAAGVSQAGVCATRTMVGGGAAPGQSLPSFAVALVGADASQRALALRRRPIPIIARIEDERVLIDLRTVEEADDRYLAESLAAVAR